MRVVRILLKVLLGIVATLVVVTALALALFHTDSVQQHLLQRATGLLQDYLGTKVSARHVSVSLFGEDFALQDVEIDDLQQRRMFRMHKLGVGLRLLPLLHGEVIVSEARIKGLETHLYRPATDSDSVANYQFVIDAFKKKPKAQEPLDSTAGKPKKHLVLEVQKVTLEQIDVTLNDTLKAHLGKLRYKQSSRGLRMAQINDLSANFVQHLKKGPVDTRVKIGQLALNEQPDHWLVDLNDLQYATDNHLPHKRTGKPKRGYFDAGHFDIVAKMLLRVDHVAKDSVAARMEGCRITDRTSGLDVKSLTLQATTNMRQLWLHQVKVKLANTTLSFDRGEVQLPSKKQGRTLAYKTSLIRGRTLLKDISRPFAPVLGHFSTPLNLQTFMSGTHDNMRFEQVRVWADKEALTVQARGRISGLHNKYQLNVHFDVSRMMTTGHYAEHIINQFVVKKFMMKQLNNLGRFTYRGGFDVLWRKEAFNGLIATDVGDLDFNFAIDENTKYVSGTVHTDSLQLGKAMDYPKLGKIVCKADFRFDISKPRTAIMRRQLGGKLPIGQISAKVDEAHYGKIRVRNLTADIISNGAVAEGQAVAWGKRMDIVCSFSFTNTNEMRKTKVRPGLRLRDLSEEEKAARDSIKLVKKAARDAERMKRKEERAARKAARDQQKAIEAEQKAALKAAKAEEKAARKAAKAEEKAARKAAKKAAKEAARQARDNEAENE